MCVLDIFVNMKRGQPGLVAWLLFLNNLFSQTTTGIFNDEIAKKFIEKSHLIARSLWAMMGDNSKSVRSTDNLINKIVKCQKKIPM